MNFGVIGCSDYFTEGLNYLFKNGYVPEFINGDDKVIDFKDIKRKFDLELLVCLGYPHILKKEEIELFPKGVINFHAGLPHYRGRHPINWMMIDGLKEIPISVHYIDEGIDTGDIIVEDYVKIERDDCYPDVRKKIIELEKKLLVISLKQIETNSVYRRKQTEVFKYTKKRTPEDSRIDWNKSSLELHHFINALSSPMPNAFMDYKGEEIKINKSYIGKNVGEILTKTTDGRYVLSALDGVLLVDLKKEKGGKNKMEGKQYVVKFGKRIEDVIKDWNIEMGRKALYEYEVANNEDYETLITQIKQVVKDEINKYNDK